MAIIKTKEEQDLSLIRKVEQDLERRERRERIHHVLIAGLAMMVLAAFAGGHYTGRRCTRRHRII